ncbi:glyoxylate utilization-related uncharacterized protein [Bradyrhizobium sp. i1.8.4]|uniref:hypothetical protein n=1 Tax=unclassified Bradyrhizobium TaxID=2631580 RepID=UPI003D226B3B
MPDKTRAGAEPLDTNFTTDIKLEAATVDPSTSTQDATAVLGDAHSYVEVQAGDYSLAAYCNQASD